MDHSPACRLRRKFRGHRRSVFCSGSRRPAQLFNNRTLEKLFQKFDSVKFFLTRENLREVIVKR
jgi:hypothetical protein